MLNSVCHLHLLNENFNFYEILLGPCNNNKKYVYSKYFETNGILHEIIISFTNEKHYDLVLNCNNIVSKNNINYILYSYKTFTCHAANLINESFNYNIFTDNLSNNLLQNDLLQNDLLQHDLLQHDLLYHSLLQHDLIMNEMENYFLNNIFNICSNKINKRKLNDDNNNEFQDNFENKKIKK